jgi:hypothetical protein
MKKITALLLTSILVLTGCNAKMQNGTPETPVPNSFNISSRNFKAGISGFAPRDFPRFGFNDLLSFWSTIRQEAEVYGIHTDWKETAHIEDSAAELEIDFELVLGFQTPEDWTTQVDAFIEVAKELLRKYPQIRYLGIGNEINIEYEKSPEQFGEFIKAYKRIYSELKAQFPEVMIFTVFQYEAMKGEGYLTGFSALRDKQFFLIDQLIDSIDLIALTFYPMLDYRTPAEIPSTYFDDVTAYGKKIAITETGWMSRETYGGLLKQLSDDGFAGSETEQADYLKWLVAASQTTSFEFINWFHLHDPFTWENGDEGAENFAAFDSISLHKNDGTEKQIWALWQELLAVPYQN